MNKEIREAHLENRNIQRELYGSLVVEYDQPLEVIEVERKEDETRDDAQIIHENKEGLRNNYIIQMTNLRENYE